MSEQDGAQTSRKRRRSHQTSKQNGKQVHAQQRPINNDKKAWTQYWATVQPKEWFGAWSYWRTEPEIDIERQKYLTERRSITSDIEKGIYPFKEVKLSRADVEWLLATHESRGIHGPVDWSDESQSRRYGLDLHGADLRKENLAGLPLARLRAGLSGYDSYELDEDQRNAAAGLLERANLFGANLQQANLGGARLQQANLFGAKLQEADLNRAQMQQANLGMAEMQKAQLDRANLQEADLNRAQMQQAYLFRANLQQAKLGMAEMQQADFTEAQMQQAYLADAQMQQANFKDAQMQKAYIGGANLQQANLERAQLQGASLCKTDLDHVTLDRVTFSDETYGPVQLADIRWGEVNLAVVDWGHVTRLGDEQTAHQKKYSNGQKIDKQRRLDEYKKAVRANRQLAVVLRDQGLNEEADHFTYRAQVLQRVVWRRQRSWSKYTFSWFLTVVAGYGYKPYRCFVIYFLALIGFTLAHYFVGALAGQHLTFVNALAVSVQSLHGRLFSFQSSDPQTLLNTIEAFVGLFIEAIVVAVITQRILGK